MDIEIENQQPTETQSEVQPQGPIDLDSVTEVKWQGESWTPEKFHELKTKAQTYETKSQEIAQKEQYIKSLQTDLRRVQRNPEMAADFKKVYPKEFHGYLEYVLPKEAQEEGKQQTGSMDPRFMERFEKFEQQFQEQAERLKEAEIKAINSHLDTLIPKLADKYPYMDEDALLARADQLDRQGYKVTDQVFERIAKQLNDNYAAKIKKIEQSKIKEQLEVGKRGADIGPGGFTPGKGPVKARSISEASDMAIKSLMQKRG